MTLIVFGAGSIGSLFGGKVAQLSPDNRKNYEPVVFVGRERHVAAIRNRGLTINSPSGESQINRVTAVTSLTQVQDIKYVLVTCKAYDNDVASSVLKTHANRRMKLFILQNGVGNEEFFLPEFKNRIYRLTTTEAARLEGPGIVNHAASGLTILGKHGGRVDRAGKEFASLLSIAGFKTELSLDVDQPVWTKFLVNIPINPLGALYRLRNGDLLKRRKIVQRFERLVTETLTVFDRMGIKTAFIDPLEEIKAVAMQTAQNKSSMLQDIERGRKTEIDFLNGQVIRLGKETGIETPENLDVYRRIKSLENRATGSLVA
ncbi:MAG: ketopantoate reductase family protein [Candidatus Odinarchaeota archaeon]